MSESINSVSHTSEQLKRHKQLPLWRRIGARARGAYPSRQERERLRRHEIGPVGRIREDAHSAVWYARKLYKTPRFVLDQPDLIPTMGASRVASVPFELSPNSTDFVHILLLFPDKGLESTSDKPVSVGVFVNKHLGLNSPVGIFVMRNHLSPATLELSDDEIQSLDPPVQEAVESVAKKAASQGFHTYQQNRPENVG